jgi:hypothetical protein
MLSFETGPGVRAGAFFACTKRRPFGKVLLATGRRRAYDAAFPEIISSRRRSAAGEQGSNVR